MSERNNEEQLVRDRAEVIKEAKKLSGESFIENYEGNKIERTYGELEAAKAFSDMERDLEKELEIERVEEKHATLDE
ncbi:MAG: hypothetical protein FWD89_04110 [Firmicutes bacterium]|nr:hypothetical protein [Bacillota bacterium]MCL2771468.1 hypothetical protein [Bacillota bacterium]